MTTQLAFAFGMLSMVAITMLVAIVIGMVKVIRLQREIKNFEQVFGREIELTHRHTTDIERNFYTEIKDFKTEFDHYTENFRDELHSYVDSRIDKSLNSKEKQLLKS